VLFRFQHYANVNISGEYNWRHHNTNGATETEADATLTISSFTQLDNGMTVAGDSLLFPSKKNNSQVYTMITTSKAAYKNQYAGINIDA